MNLLKKEKCLVFSSFNGPLLELADIYEEESVLLIGSTPVDERQEIIRKFQEDSDTKIFLGGIKSSGIGVTLTEATTVIFIDRSWNPADHNQAEDRMHRIGQEAQSVNIYTITGRDTIDDFMIKLLQHKQEIIDLLVEGKEQKDNTDGMVDDYIRQLKLKHRK